MLSLFEMSDVIVMNNLDNKIVCYWSIIIIIIYCDLF